MDDALGRGRYVEPQITDHGDLVALTSAMHLLYGSAADPTARDMSFSGTTGGGGGAGTNAANGSSPVSAAGASTPATQTPGGVQNVTTTAGGGQGPAGASPSVGGGGSAPGAGAGGGGGLGPGGDSLPFTGYPAAAVAAIGGGLVAAGAALRRAVRLKRAQG
jgi:hypothetical protein